MVRASVIVPARDAESTLPRTLEALAAQDLQQPFEIIVVDDGSSDGTAAAARSAPGPVTVLQQAATGPAAARNAGVARSSTRALAFCDADVYPTRSWLREGLAALESADLVQGRVLPDPSAEVGPYDRTLWIEFEVGLYETANLFVTREAFDLAGGFEEWLRPEIGKAMAEDVLFGWKARRNGARTTFAPAALAHHHVFARAWRDYAGERRRLRYFPAMAAKVPELREAFFYRRLFLNRRSAALDLAVAGVLAAALVRSPLPALAAAPYGSIVARRARGFGRRAIGVAAADVAADLVGLAGLVQGSARYRSLLL